MKARILLVDAQREASEQVGRTLGPGFELFAATDGKEGLRLARLLRPHLILLELAIPLLDGFEVCKELRRDPTTARLPIIIVAATTSEVDRILSLELGADDYLAKPCSPRELLSRVKARLRAAGVHPEPDPRLDFGDLLIDVPCHEVTVKGKRVHVTFTEFKLLLRLVEGCDQIHSRARLLQDLWHSEAAKDCRRVDTHIRRLRRKLGPAARHLKTVRGVGYRFVNQD